MPKHNHSGTSQQRPRKKNNGRRSKPNMSSLNARPTTINWNVPSGSQPGMKNLIKKDNQKHTFIQSSIQGNVMTSNAAVPTTYAKSFTSADILQFSSFASIFDQYKIDFVEVWFTPYGAALNANYNANVRIYTVVDYDDANTGSLTPATMQEYTNCVTTRCTEGHYIKFKPHQAKAIYGGTFTAFGNEPAGWIDCASTAASMYGVKALIEPTSSAGDLKIDLVSRITVSFRNTF
jgi:hypothetical protein